MSEPTDNAITPGVKKTTRRFAPVKRGASKSAAGLKREEAAAAAASTSVPESSTDSKPETPTSSAASEHAKSTPIGTMRPEGVNSGRLQSVNEGQKTRGGSAKVNTCIHVTLQHSLILFFLFDR